MHELTFALHLYSLQLVIYDGPRDGADDWKKGFQAKGPEWLTGTIDWLGNDGHVDDLKTGSWQPDHKESKQLRSYLLVPWTQRGNPLTSRLPQSMTWWPKYRLDAKPKRNGRWIRTLALAEHLDDLRHAVENPEEVNVTPDEYDDYGRLKKMSTCVFCPCREETPQTSWMQHYRYRAAPACMPGMLSTIDWS